MDNEVVEIVGQEDSNAVDKNVDEDEHSLVSSEDLSFVQNATNSSKAVRLSTFKNQSRKDFFNCIFFRMKVEMQLKLRSLLTARKNRIYLGFRLIQMTYALEF